MFRINKMTRGRFGNKILQYNTLRQLSSILGVGYSCPNWEGNKIFDLSLSSENQQVYKQEKLLTWRECIEPNWDSLKEMSNKYDLIIDDPAYLLHNTFFQLSQTSPRKFLPIKEHLSKILPSDRVNVGIHIRGTDFLTADNGKEVHPFDYYCKSVEEVANNISDPFFIICTDDITYDLVGQVINMLSAKNFEFSMGRPDNLFYDFLILAHCEVLISTSSTFAVTAGMLGLSDKKIIHYSKWLKRCVDNIPWNKKALEDNDTRQWHKSFDNFWKIIHEGGSEHYKMWRMI